MPRTPDLLDRSRSLLLVIDVQARLVRAMPDTSRLVSRTVRLVRGARRLGVPVLVTEQVPAKLGGTVPVIEAELDGVPKFAKLAFSACGDPAVSLFLDEAEVDQVVLCGIEAHVCVQQTALDLLVRGVRPFVAVDAVQSRHDDDARVALDRLRDAGAVLTTSEAVLFEWLRGADAPEFRDVQALVKDPPPAR